MSFQELDLLVKRQHSLIGQREQTTNAYNEEISRVNKAEHDLTEELLRSLKVDREELVSDAVVWDLVRTAQDNAIDPGSFIKGFMNAVFLAKNPHLTGEEIPVEEDSNPFRLIRFGIMQIGEIKGAERGPNLTIANDAFRKALGILEANYNDEPTVSQREDVELIRYIQMNAGELADISTKSFWANY